MVWLSSAQSFLPQGCPYWLTDVRELFCLPDHSWETFPVVWICATDCASSMNVWMSLTWVLSSIQHFRNTFKSLRSCSMALLEALGAPNLSNSLLTEKRRCPPLLPLSWCSSATLEVRSGEGKGRGKIWPKSNLSSGLCLIVWNEGSTGLFFKDVPARQLKERGFVLWLLIQCHFVFSR